MGLTVVIDIDSFFQYTKAENESALSNNPPAVLKPSFIQTLKDGDVLVAAKTVLIMNNTSTSSPDIYNLTDLIRQGALRTSLNEDQTINFSMSKEKRYSYKSPWKVMDAILKKLNDPASASEIPGCEHCREVLFAQIFSAIPPHLMRPSLTAGE